MPYLSASEAMIHEEAPYQVYVRRTFTFTLKIFRGKQQVTKSKKWRDVSSALNIGPSSSAGFTLKKNYGKHLFPFECRFDRGNIDPAPLLAFLDQPSKKESKKAAAERAAAVAAGASIHFRGSTLI